MPNTNPSEVSASVVKSFNASRIKPYYNMYKKVMKLVTLYLKVYPRSMPNASPAALPEGRPSFWSTEKGQ